MSMQVLINLFIGLLWMFLQDDWSVLTFAVGYLFGLLVLFILRRFFNDKFYIFTLNAIIQLFLLFMYELLISSILVMRKILAYRLDIKPGIIAMETSLISDLEVTLLALLVTLTPGSVVMEVSEDNKILYTHIMDIPELSISVLNSAGKFEEAIKKVTRP